MCRVLLWLGLIGTGCFTAPSAAAQDNEVGVQLFAFAEFSFYFTRRDRVRYPTIAEYRELSRWAANPYDDSRSPAYFDLVAVVENFGTHPVGSIELELTRNRKVGEFFDDSIVRPPYPKEAAQWEGAIGIETTTVGSLDGKTATVVRFGPFAVRELLEDLLAQDAWPWQVKYEVTLQCGGCASSTDSASFTMAHSL